jgi:thiol-disulfide isomerase/thioredoxin
MDHPTRQEIGRPVPEIVLPALDGTERKMDSFLAGKKGLVVVFWSETCSHCVRYDSYLNTFVERHPEIGLLAVAARRGEGLQEIRTAAAERRLRFPILHDAEGYAARQWFVQQTPRAFLIDAGRRLLYRGAIDNYKYPEDPEYAAYLEPAITAFLSDKPIERAETASFGCAVQSVYYILPKALS